MKITFLIQKGKTNKAGLAPPRKEIKSQLEESVLFKVYLIAEKKLKI